MLNCCDVTLAVGQFLAIDFWWDWLHQRSVSSRGAAPGEGVLCTRKVRYRSVRKSDASVQDDSSSARLSILRDIFFLCKLNILHNYIVFLQGYRDDISGSRATNLRFTQIKSQTQTYEFCLTWDISDLVCHQPKSYSTYARFYLIWDLRFFSVAKSVIFDDFHAINSTKASKCFQIRYQSIPLTVFFEIIQEKHDRSAFINIIHSVSDLQKSQLRSQT